MNEPIYVYMLRSVKKPNVIKIASTTNLNQMLQKANTPSNTIAGWLSPWELLLTESYLSHQEASEREAYLRVRTFKEDETECYDY